MKRYLWLFLILVSCSAYAGGPAADIQIPVPVNQGGTGAANTSSAAASLGLLKADGSNLVASTAFTLQLDQTKLGGQGMATNTMISYLATETLNRIASDALLAGMNGSSTQNWKALNATFSGVLSIATTTASAGCALTVGGNIAASGAITLIGSESVVVTKNKYIPSVNDATGPLIKKITAYWTGSAWGGDGGNLAIGDDAGKNANIQSCNTAIGDNSMKDATGGNSAYNNVAVGYEAMKAYGGVQEVAIGYQAQGGASGYNGVSIGCSAGFGNSGIRSSGIGMNSLFSNGGNDCNGFGYDAKYGGSGSGCNAFGNYSMFTGAGAGTNHSAFGDNTLRYLSVGSNNSVFGGQAGTFAAGGNLTSASGVVLIGMSASPLANGGSNEIVIGVQAVGNGTNTITLGNASVTQTILRVPTAEYADNAAAVAAGLATGTLYRIGDMLKIVHN